MAFASGLLSRVQKRVFFPLSNHDSFGGGGSPQRGDKRMSSRRVHLPIFVISSGVKADRPSPPSICSMVP